MKRASGAAMPVTAKPQTMLVGQRRNARPLLRKCSPHNLLRQNRQLPKQHKSGASLLKTMATSNSRIERVRCLIDAAFSETKYPGDERLVYDNSGEHLECNEIATAFRGKHWRQLALEVIRRQASAVFFLTPEAYQFYLPAYLLAALLHYDEADTVTSSIVFSFIPPSNPKDAEVYRQRIGSLTDAQRSAVKALFEYLKHEHLPDDVLGDWDKAIASL